MCNKYVPYLCVCKGCWYEIWSNVHAAMKLVNKLLCWVHIFVNLTLKESVPHQPWTSQHVTDRNNHRSCFISVAKWSPSISEHALYRALTEKSNSAILLNRVRLDTPMILAMQGTGRPRFNKCVKWYEENSNLGRSVSPCLTWTQTVCELFCRSSTTNLWRLVSALKIQRMYVVKNKQWDNSESQTWNLEIT